MLISESHKNRLKKLAGLEEGKVLRMTNPEITKGWEKSSQRYMGYNEQMMKDAIANGQVIGISYQSEGMPVTKFRFVLPVVLGTYKNGTKKLRAYHLKGQSEKIAKKTGTRSAEAAGEWRLFDVDNNKFKGMWLTDKTIADVPEDIYGNEYKANDSQFSSIIAKYDPAEARQRQVSKPPEGEAEPVDIKLPAKKPTDVTSDITGYELDEEKQKKEKNPFYVKKPWLRKKRGRWSRYFQEGD